MNSNEVVIASALLFETAAADYREQLDRLYHIKPPSDTLEKLITARMSALLKNESSPDVVGEFYRAGGSVDQYADMLDAIRSGEMTFMLTPSVLRGAIDREVSRQHVERLRPMLDAMELGRCSVEDVASALLDAGADRESSATLPEILEAEKLQPDHGRVDICFPVLDHILKGLMRRHVTILAARPAVGKSDFALALARGVMAKGGSVFVASLEMGRYEIVHRLRNGAGNEAMLRALPGSIRVDDRGDLTVPQIAAGANMEHADLVIVDHMQLLHYPHRVSGLYERLTMLSNQLRVAAKHSGAAWLVLSQLSRGTEDEHAVPKLSTLRDSGAIEQDAYAVLFLHEPEKRDHSVANRRIALSVAKNRGGSGGVIHYRFTPMHSEWEEE